MGAGCAGSPRVGDRVPLGLGGPATTTTTTTTTTNNDNNTNYNDNNKHDLRFLCLSFLWFVLSDRSSVGEETKTGTRSKTFR